MRRITAIVALVVLIATKSMSQSATEQKVSWEPNSSYRIAAAAASLGVLIASKYPVEITPQIGPSLNWFRNNTEEFREFYNNTTEGQIGIQLGNVIGYSAGAMISTVKPGLNFKSGLFLESKGRSWTSQGWLDDAPYNIEGYSKINYFTIPFSIGISSDGQRAVFSLDLGGFLSLPVSEYHENTINGVTSQYEPLETVGLDGGLLTDVGVKLPINDRLSFRTDLRWASGLANTQRLVYSAYTQSAQILFGVSFRPKSK